MKTNMEIYEAARAVPQEAQKQFNNGRFSGTDINPMWRIKKLTEIFGPAGIGWYTEILSERCEEHGDSDTIAIVDLNLFVKVDGEWSKPIYGTGGNVIKRMTKYQKLDVSDEGYKMAYTDALSVACKALGIGADIYFSQDKTKYTRPQEPSEPEQKPKPRPKPSKLQVEVPFTMDEEQSGPMTEAHAEPAKEPVIKCTRCGEAIRANRKLTVNDIASRTIAKFGYPYCLSCASKKYEEESNNAE